MDPLDSAGEEENLPPPPVDNRRVAQAPGKVRNANPPLPPTARSNPAPPNKKAAAQPAPGDDLFGFGSSLTVKGRSISQTVICEVFVLRI